MGGWVFILSRRRSRKEARAHAKHGGSVTAYESRRFGVMEFTPIYHVISHRFASLLLYVSTSPKVLRSLSAVQPYEIGRDKHLEGCTATSSDR